MSAKTSISFTNGAYGRAAGAPRGQDPPVPAVDRFDRQAVNDHHESPEATLATEWNEPIERIPPA